ncbi:hypothetical protein TTHERM_00654160 (macronuclear) [Tetrahymena thermophila SB210]|uniref:Uncharacterized protein n=1 Tax=Tetrahymena thermophila (strain SB210) TaxID=312017 RepID=Q23AW1_TETTS|nr:hypothetical protein TTHERM_00654160 [Tetrahymena thermophila SB210]EAR93723.2 hypothetical protein TTHERM_00654160 [Tetrahymena thermophila SB210]|eukprot:XP_001013968.2 hypothetical protein TTHERM_00654160 [Tetrahymena thermophila SB210]
MIFFIKFTCCKKYFFSKKKKIIYLQKRWVKSFRQVMSEKNIINLWTGKLKVDRLQAASVLLGQQYIQNQQSLTPVLKTKAQNSQNIEMQRDPISLIYSQQIIESSINQKQIDQIINQQINSFLAKKSQLFNRVKSSQYYENQSLNDTLEPQIQLENSNFNYQLQNNFSPNNIKIEDKAQSSIFDDQKIDEETQPSSENQKFNLKQTQFKTFQNLNANQQKYQASNDN